MPEKQPVRKIRLSHTVELPNRVRMELYRRSPALGPKILFFSGGSALRPLSERLLEYTHNSIHLITPFDSGGSSAIIRKAFNMLAVGDIRNRIMALADRSVKGNPEIFELFAYRLPKQAERPELKERLERMIRGEDPMVKRITDPMRKIIRTHLRFFVERMPEHFDLKGASIGNLILTGGYFNYNRQIDPVIYVFSRLVESHGAVRPIVNADLQLAVELEDGRIIVGQHLLTGKEAPPIASRVKKVWLTQNQESAKPVETRIREKVIKQIRSADLICYPMGSFYSSVVANLLPRGVGDAVALNDCPKVYVPNSGRDPEQFGMSVPDLVKTLLSRLEASCLEPRPREKLLQYVLVDTKNGVYDAPVDAGKIRRLGVEVIDAPLTTPESLPHLESRAVIEHLLSLA